MAQVGAVAPTAPTDWSVMRSVAAVKLIEPVVSLQARTPPVTAHSSVVSATPFLTTVKVCVPAATGALQ